MVDDAQPHDVVAVCATATHPAHREIKNEQQRADGIHQSRRWRRSGEVAGVEKEEKCEDPEVAHTQRNDEDAEVDGSCGGACHQPGAMALEGPGLAGYRIDVRAHRRSSCLGGSAP